jgi:hypothetical protein
MAIDFSRESTLGWFHPGFLFEFPDIITSTEHYRRLHHVNAVALSIIGATITAASLAGGANKFNILPATTSSRGGWGRIVTRAEGPLHQQNLVAIRHAIGATSLTLQALREAQQNRESNRDAVAAMLAVTAEAGFRDPSALLIAASPVLVQTVADQEGAPPQLRQKSYLKSVYGLLPDIELAVSQFITSAEVASAHPASLDLEK